MLALLPSSLLARLAFSSERARALIAGLAAHSFLPLTAPFTSSFAVIFAASAHAFGWPLPRGGSQRIADALVSVLRSLGGEVVVGSRVTQFSELGPAGAYLFDTSPHAL